MNDRRYDSFAATPTLTGRGFTILQWLIPTIVWVLMPKCPACLAGYIALATGVGVSMTVASSVRELMLLFCVVSFTYLLATRLRRHVLRPKACSPQ